jgi:hypothetical protein
MYTDPLTSNGIMYTDPLTSNGIMYTDPLTSKEIYIDLKDAKINNLI